MIISDKNRYVFVEIPHTGSHSIAAELVAHYGGVRIMRKHANLTQFMAQATAQQRQYFVFGTVRNPLDSAVTDYSKLESNHRGQYTNVDALMVNGGHLTPQHMKEFEFVQGPHGDFTSFMKAFRRRIYHNWFLIGSERYDFVLRFENIREDFRKLIGLLGLELVQDLPHVNPTKKKTGHYFDYYEGEMREFAARYYGPFMKKWQYEFPPDWGNVEVPGTSILRFALVEGMVGAVARFAKLDPDHPVLSRAKRLVDAAF
jgi:hypothetical protein